MAVLQFGFDGNAANPHHPNGIQADQIVYTGTHDNNTTCGWWETLDAKVQRRVRGLMMPDETPTSAMIRLACESGGAMAMLPLQDLLELGTSARMNTPGTHQNWSWSFAWSDLNAQECFTVNIITPFLIATLMPPIAYFTAEIGLWSELHTYSGGLGVLAGDHVKSAADARLPLVAMSLLYREGYGRQHLDKPGTNRNLTHPSTRPSTSPTREKPSSYRWTAPRCTPPYGRPMWSGSQATSSPCISLTPSIPTTRRSSSGWGPIVRWRRQHAVRQEYLLGVGAFVPSKRSATTSPACTSTKGTARLPCSKCCAKVGAERNSLNERCSPPTHPFRPATTALTGRWFETSSVICSRTMPKPWSGTQGIPRKGVVVPCPTSPSPSQPR